MKIINTKKIKIFAFIILAIAVFLLFVVFNSNKQIKSTSLQDSPILQVAPDALINKNVFQNNFKNQDENNIQTPKNELNNRINAIIGENSDSLEPNNPQSYQIETQTNNSNTRYGIIKSLNMNPSVTLISEKEAKQQMSKSNYEPQSFIKSLNQSVYSTQNAQNEKKDFIASFTENGIDFLTECDIAPGTVIPIVLITSINSDLPGEIIGQVNANIYDTLTNNNLLIPKGTRVLAKYDSQISYGQERILIAWNTLIREDGVVVGLPGFQGIDNTGANGYRGNVNTHFYNILSSATLSSIINIAESGISTLTNNSTINSILNSIGKTSADCANELLEKEINRQPTITVPAGKSEKLLVNQKLTLPLLYSHNNQN